MKMTILNIATTLSIGLLIGTELTVSMFIHPVLRMLEPSTQIATIRLFAKRLGSAMPFWYAASLVLLLAESVTRSGEPGRSLLIGASIDWAAVIALSVFFLVPINNRLARGTGSDSAELDLREHHKWEAIHRVRVAALAVAMVCFLLATGA